MGALAIQSETYPRFNSRPVAWQKRSEALRAAVLRYTRKKREEWNLSTSAAINLVVDEIREGEIPAWLSEALREAKARRKKSPAVSRATLYNWLKQSELNKLAPKRHAPVESGWPPWADALLKEWQDPRKPTFRGCVRRLNKAFLQRASPIKPPTLAKARYFTRGLPAVTLNKCRKRGSADQSLLPFKRRDTSNLEPHDFLCGDGHSFKAWVAHPVTSHEFHPEVTVLIDAATRRITFWSAGLAENSHGVLEALKMAIQKGGVPAILQSDNGAGYTAKLLSEENLGILDRLGVTHKANRPGNSQENGIIERAHQVLTRAAKRLLSYTGRDMDALAKRNNYRRIQKSKRKGALAKSRTLPSWKQFLSHLKDSIDEYNRAIHSTLGMSPLEAWENHRENGWKPFEVADSELNFTKKERRKCLRKSKSTAFLIPTQN